jgi:hypothetical protein
MSSGQFIHIGSSSVVARLLLSLLPWRGSNPLLKSKFRVLFFSVCSDTGWQMEASQFNRL